MDGKSALLKNVQTMDVYKTLHHQINVSTPHTLFLTQSNSIHKDYYITAGMEALWTLFSITYS